MSSENYLNRAMAAHRSGDLESAARYCQSALRVDQRNGAALHLIGVIEGQRGKFEASASWLNQARRVLPQDIQVLGNLGRVYADWGKESEAIACYSEIVRLTPHDPVACFHLGVAFRTFGRDEEALQAFGRGIQIAPNFAQAFFEAGSLLRRLGRAAESENALRSAIRLNPTYAEAYHSLGNLFKDQSDSARAIENYKRALEIKPSDSKILLDLARTYSTSFMYTEAVVAFESLLKLTPNSIDALVGYALACSDLDQFAQAYAACVHAESISPNDPVIEDALGEIDTCCKNHSSAVAHFNRAIAFGSKRANSWLGLGVCYNFMGRFADAARAFRKALEIEPKNSMALRGLMVAPKVLSFDEADKLKLIIADMSLPAQDRISAGFALGKMLDDAEQYDDAFAEFKNANEVVKRLRESEGHRFDLAELQRSADDLIQAFTPEYFLARKDWGDLSELPVLIVGMPRSGTTLVEQICASHTAVYGAGECAELSTYSVELKARYGNLGPPNCTKGDITELSSKYLHAMNTKSERALRVVDKMPGNIFHLGLFATMFPGARVIFCDRDPRDNCLSCYFQWFARNHLLFAYDLVHCANQFNEQQRLNRTWDQVLPLRTLHVQYEELVNNLENQSRKIIEFLGLGWEPGCLEFYKNERTVQTASVWQVRQPIYTNSVGRWRHYEKHLQPLFQALGEQQV